MDLFFFHFMLPYTNFPFLKRTKSHTHIHTDTCTYLAVIPVFVDNGLHLLPDKVTVPHKGEHILVQVDEAAAASETGQVEHGSPHQLGNVGQAAAGPGLTLQGFHIGQVGSASQLTAPHHRVTQHQPLPELPGIQS